MLQQASSPHRYVSLECQLIWRFLTYHWLHPCLKFLCGPLHTTFKSCLNQQTRYRVIPSGSNTMTCHVPCNQSRPQARAWGQGYHGMQQGNHSAWAVQLNCAHSLTSAATSFGSAGYGQTQSVIRCTKTHLYQYQTHTSYPKRKGEFGNLQYNIYGI